MYIEAICPLCLASHVLPADRRGTRYRCEECEEVFVVNRRSKRTDKRPTRPRKVRPADEMDQVAPADEPEVLPVATEARSRRRGRADDKDDARPRPARRPRGRLSLAVSLAAVFIVLCWAGGAGVWWYVWGRHPDGQAQADNHQPDAPRVAAGQPVEAPEPKKETPPPKKEPPRQDPTKLEGPPPWKAKADPPPPAALVRLPENFTKEISGRAAETKVVFPTATGSPFVAVGDNSDDKDERQVWNLQTGEMTGKVVGRHYTIERPALSPDGAHLAILPFGEKEMVDVIAPATGKSVRIDTAGLPTDVVDFAGPGRLLVAGKHGPGTHVCIWDATTGKREREFDGPPLGAATGLSRDMVAISPGGTWLAVATPENLSLWDLKKGTPAGQRALPWNGGNWLFPCRGLSFSPDGRELAGLFQAGGRSRLVCWGMNGDAPAHEVTFPELHLWDGAVMMDKGQVIGWVGDRRGWLLYGQMFIDRKADRVGPSPPGLLAGDQPFRRMVGTDHVATLPGGPGGKKALTISPFDPEKPGGP